MTILPRALLLSAFLVGGCTPNSDELDGGDAGPPAYCTTDLSYLMAEFGSVGPNNGPTLDPTFQRPEGAALDFNLRMYPPERASFSQYWIDGDLPLEIRLRWMLGTAYDFEADIVVHAYIDGTPIELDGSFERRMPLVDGLVEYRTSIPADSFPTGRSVLHVHYALDTGRLRAGGGLSTVLPPIAVFRETTYLLTSFEDSSGFTSTTSIPGYRTTAIRSDAPDRPFSVVLYPPDGGEFRVELRAQTDPSWIPNCPGTTDTFALLAQLDGQPIAMGSFGDRIVSTQAGTERRIFDVVLSGLPVDGNRHRLEIVQLSGLGHVFEGAHGEPTAWPAQGGVVAQAEWFD